MIKIKCIATFKYQHGFPYALFPRITVYSIFTQQIYSQIHTNRTHEECKHCVSRCSHGLVSNKSQHPHAYARFYYTCFKRTSISKLILVRTSVAARCAGNDPLYTIFSITRQRNKKTPTPQFAGRLFRHEHTIKLHTHTLEPFSIFSLTQTHAYAYIMYIL